MSRWLLSGLVLTATVAAPASAQTPAPSTISVAPATVIYSHSVTLSGRFADRRSGQTVLMLSREFGTKVFSAVALISTSTGGAWHFKAAPRLETTYKAQSGTETTGEAIARVRPLVTLRAADGGFLARVVSVRSYDHAFVLLQLRARKHWRTLRRVGLGRRPGTIHVRLPRGTSKVRVYLPQGQAGAGYLAAASRPVVVRR